MTNGVSENGENEKEWQKKKPSCEFTYSKNKRKRSLKKKLKNLVLREKELKMNFGNRPCLSRQWTRNS